MKKEHYEREITVELEGTYEEIKEILNKQNFRLITEVDYIDKYMIKKSTLAIDPLEKLNDCILLRRVIGNSSDKKYILYKQKEYNSKKEIINQSNTYCEVFSLTDAKCLVEAMGYKPYIDIIDHIKVFSNDNISIAIQLVNDKHIYLEFEDDGRYNSIDEMKQELDQYNLPIKGNDYFVKKALNEIIESTADFQ